MNHSSVVTPMSSTVGSLIQRVMPNGTASNLSIDYVGHKSYKSKKNFWSNPPAWPADLFAVAGHLLQRSGIYPNVIPEYNGDYADETDSVGLLQVQRSDVVSWQRAAKVWRESADGTKVPRLVIKNWNILWKHSATSILLHRKASELEKKNRG